MNPNKYPPSLVAAMALTALVDRSSIGLDESTKLKPTRRSEKEMLVIQKAEMKRQRRAAKRLKDAGR